MGRKIMYLHQTQLVYLVVKYYRDAISEVVKYYREAIRMEKESWDAIRLLRNRYSLLNNSLFTITRKLIKHVY